MGLNTYLFRSLWQIPFPADRVFAKLADVGRYPEWWPEFKAAKTVGADTYALTIRSFLPIDLTLRSARTVHDQDAGVLQTKISGALDGWLRWEIADQGAGNTLVTCTERAEPQLSVMRSTALVARPLFRFNHTLMMRHGHRGLCACLDDQ